jgi:4-diphosphocytidyl-2-C-methyl-D-erythritol kinase
MICFPNIKINLGLQVINRRTDGFHNIESVFYPVSFCDMLEVIGDVSGQRGKMEFTTTGLPVAGALEDNLVYKAYLLLHRQFDLPAVKAHLHKLIPMGAGLGGGSSNAAYMIMLLNLKYNLGLTTAQMEEYAGQLGSDCAFFIRNTPAYLFGKGHEMEPHPLNLSGYYFVLLYANVHCNTALAYQHVAKREVLTPEQSLKKVLQQPVEQWKQTVENDFEQSVFLQFPQLSLLKEQLYAQGALYASMSGSGSAVYGIFRQKPQLDEELRPLVCYEGLLP